MAENENERFRTGKIEQIVFPIAETAPTGERNVYSLNLNPNLGYQIGISIEEKAFMFQNKPNDDNHFRLKFIFQNGSSYENEIEIGKTYIYEPSNIVNLTGIEFSPCYWKEQETITIDSQEYICPIGKAYLEIMTVPASDYHVVFPEKTHTKEEKEKEGS